MKKVKKIFWIVCSLLMGALLSFTGARALVHSKQLAARGKTTTGRVTDSEERIGGRYRTHSYYLTVDFKPGEEPEIRKEIKVARAVFDSTSIGGTVKVWYLAEDPAICAAGDQVDLRYGTLLYGLAFIGFSVFLMVTFNRPADTEEAAEKIADRFKILTVPRFEYGPAKAEDFKHLDLAFYNDSQRQLEALGYTFVADEENLTVKKTGTHALLRRLLSRDQATTATLYHFKKFGLKEAKVLDLETWLSNGGFICTSNATSAGKLNYPPAIDAFFFSAGAPIDAVVQAHEHRLTAFFTQNPGVQTIVLNGLEGIRRAGDEMQRIKSEFRGQAGLSKAELERIAGKSSPQLDEIHAAVAEQQANPRRNNDRK